MFLSLGVGLLFFVAAASAGPYGSRALAGDGRVDICPPIGSTPRFTLVYGALVLDGRPAPAGTVVTALTPRGQAAGCSAVTSPGLYGAMQVYGEDTSVSPPVAGMRSGEVPAFQVNGVPATGVPALAWEDDRAYHQVDLAAVGPTPTATPPPAEKRLYLPLVRRQDNG